MKEHIKIITTYFGDRRKPPRDAAECLRALKRSWHYEQRIDPGVDTDTVYINNVPYEDDKVSDGQKLEECYNYLHSLDGRKTARGVVRVVDRENIGMSYGAYNYAYEQFGQEYKYFFFIEDDHVMITDDYFKAAVLQLNTLSPPEFANIGFVAIVRRNVRDYHLKRKARTGKIHSHMVFAAGGIGATTSSILKQVHDKHGKLPHHDKKIIIDSDGHKQQRRDGEYEFTGVIYRMGYAIEMISLKECCSCWGESRLRSDSMKVLSRSHLLGQPH